MLQVSHRANEIGICGWKGVARNSQPSMVPSGSLAASIWSVRRQRRQLRQKRNNVTELGSSTPDWYCSMLQCRKTARLPALVSGCQSSPCSRAAVNSAADHGHLHLKSPTTTACCTTPGTTRFLCTQGPSAASAFRDLHPLLTPGSPRRPYNPCRRPLPPRNPPSHHPTLRFAATFMLQQVLS